MIVHFQPRFSGPPVDGLCEEFREALQDTVNAKAHAVQEKWRCWCDVALCHSVLEQHHHHSHPVRKRAHFTATNPEELVSPSPHISQNERPARHIHFGYPQELTLFSSQRGTTGARSTKMAYKRSSVFVGLPDQDRGWEEVQAKTFTKWLNTKLESRQIAPMRSLATDLSDGVKLVQ